MLEFTKVLLLVAFNVMVISFTLVFVTAVSSLVHGLIKEQINKKGGEK